MGVDFAKLEGRTFGRLTVVERAPQPRYSKWGRFWKCRCSCGAERVVGGSLLAKGTVVSCGCYRNENNRINRRKHGHTAEGSNSRTYESWRGMIERCNNPKHVAFARYGGRGIVVCERWQSFENFLVDMGERPDGLELDRINNDLNYEIGNCRWTTRVEQMRHKKGLPFGSRAA